MTWGAALTNNEMVTSSNAAQLHSICTTAGSTRNECSMLESHFGSAGQTSGKRGKNTVRSHPQTAPMHIKKQSYVLFKRLSTWVDSSHDASLRRCAPSPLLESARLLGSFQICKANKRRGVALWIWQGPLHQASSKKSVYNYLLSDTSGNLKIQSK